MKKNVLAQNAKIRTSIACVSKSFVTLMLLILTECFNSVIKSATTVDTLFGGLRL